MTSPSASLRIVFVGAVDFSRHCLHEVVRAGGDVVAVVTLPLDRSRRHADFVDLGETAQSYGIPVYRVGQISDPASVELLRSLRPDVVFVFGWSQILRPEVLDVPRLGCIGTHPALLPKNRGRHPLIWALVEGLSESGLTFFYLDEGADSGDLLWQQPFPIAVTDDAASLYGKIKSLASTAIVEFLPQLQAGCAPRIRQDHAQATYWRQRSERDGEICWKRSSREIYNLVRALARPYVGAHTSFAGGRMTVWKAAPPSADQEPYRDKRPGEVLASSGPATRVRTGDGSLELLDYTLDDARPLSAGALLGAAT